ncbi:uncharacterized protein [Mycetomoellerius zeteki]|uniref:uncharacterized protein n=1 Tax=Mycetomoellerius zeteki TaxID=64791 RepID=UPI00084E6013|nr:PREDICTED: uncharacterized protein LOC108730078 [Trachymyrmex zeteki]
MASERWKDDVAYAITPFKLVAWSIGIWPFQVHNIYSLIRYVVGISGPAFMLIKSSFEVYLGCTDAETSVDCLMLICCAILGVLKAIWFRIYAKNLATNYRSVMEDYLTIENIKERAIMRKHAFMGRTLCCLVLGFGCFSSIMYGLNAILNEYKHVNITKDTMLEYPVPSKCFMRYLNAPSLMVILPSIELFTDCNNAEQNVDSLMLLCCGILGILKTVWFRIHARNLTNNYSSALNDYFMIKNAKHRAIMRKHASTGRILCCNDSLFFNITLHICGQVEVLKAKFIDFDVTKPQVYKRFLTLIKRHSYLIRLARELADTISFILLIQLSIISLQLCIMGFQFILALKYNDTAMAAKSIMVQSTFLSQLTLYSFVGDYLKSQMEEVGLCIYQNTWYDFPTKLTRNLIFIIMRSESPVTLRAGHFIVVNLSTYMSILKASITYLSVLRVMVEI